MDALLLPGPGESPSEGQALAFWKELYFRKAFANLRNSERAFPPLFYGFYILGSSLNQGPFFEHGTLIMKRALKRNLI